MKSRLKIVNPAALTDAIDALEKVATESVLRQATVAGARVIFDEVKMRAPVRTAWEGAAGKQQREPGFLRDHILIAYDSERSVTGVRATYLITWSKEAFYGAFVERGTSKMAAQPFLRPGYEAKRDAAARKVGEVIGQKIREMKGE
jgi:HK97 gp10 family phage protein